MIRAALLLVFVGCVSSEKVVCDDGRICPPGYTCDDTLVRCVSPEQQAACNGVAESQTCEFSGAPGTCHGGYCEPLLCGDGVIGGNELCDAADLGSATCKTAGFYEDAGLACTKFCTFDTSACTGFCGDGLVNGPELCDGAPPTGTCVSEGFDAGPLACGQSCNASFASCARFGWSSEPTNGLAAMAIAGTSHTDQWVVGGGGRIAHYNGSGWSEVVSGTTQDLVAIASASPTEAWAVSIGPQATDPTLLLHYTGTWQVVAAPPAIYTNVAAIDPAHVYFATSNHEIVWWDGAAFQTLPGPGGALALIQGTSPTDLWVTKANGSLWHYNGTWSAATLAGSFTSIVTVSAANVWVVGSVGAAFTPLVAHWDGAQWNSYLDPAGRNIYAVAAAAASNDVWVATTVGDVIHFDGLGWTPIGVTSQSVGLVIKSFGPGEVMGAGRNGLAYRYRGQAFGSLSAPGTTDSVGIWSDRPSDIFALSSHEVLHFDGARWSRQLANTMASFASIWGSGPSDVWAAAATALYHFDGNTWSLSSAPAGALQRVWGTSASDVWIATSSGLYHGPGAWTQELVATTLWTSLSGTTANDVWAVGDAGLWHWDGTVWTSHAIPATRLAAVSARTATDVWVSAAGAHMLHWNGATWTDVYVPVVSDVHSIYALAPDDVVAASANEMIHFDGQTWSPIKLDVDSSSNPLVQLYVAAPDRFDLIFLNKLPNKVRELIRTKLWNCRATERNCDDAIDDDCDGLIDHLDPDCP